MEGTNRNREMVYLSRRPFPMSGFQTMMMVSNDEDDDALPESFILCFTIVVLS